MKNIPSSFRKNKALVMPQFLTIGVLAVAVTLLGFRQYSRSGTVPVVVAKTEIKAGQKLLNTHLSTERVAKDKVPEGAIQNPKQVIGKTIQRPVSKANVLTVVDFRSPRTARGYAQHVPPGHVLINLNLLNKTFPTQGFVMGDRIDILVTGIVPAGRGKNVRKTQVLARNILIIGFSGGSRASSVKDEQLGIDVAGLTSPMGNTDSASESQLLLAVRPEDVLKIAQIDNEPSYNIGIVLHGSHEQTTGRPLVIENVPMLEKDVVEVIHGSRSEIVQVP